MSKSERSEEQAVRETAYFIWEQEGRPDGRAEDHWVRATSEGFAEPPARADEPMEDEEKVLAGRLDVNLPAMLTKDVPGG
jgi:hypothetical protein